MKTLSGINGFNSFPLLISFLTSKCLLLFSLFLSLTSLFLTRFFKTLGSITPSSLLNSGITLFTVSISFGFFVSSYDFLWLLLIYILGVFFLSELFLEKLLLLSSCLEVDCFAVDPLLLL